MTKLAFDKDNNIIHIDKAMSKIDYFCADCGSRLRVKNGKVKSKHFFHVNADDCGGTGESLIHQYYKDVISKYKTVKLPIYDLDNECEVYVREYKEFNVVGSNKEVRLLEGKLIADVVLTLDNGQNIAIEVCYRNPKTEEHINMYRQIGLPIIEFKIDDDFRMNDGELLYSKRLDLIKSESDRLANIRFIDTMIDFYNERPFEFSHFFDIGKARHNVYKKGGNKVYKSDCRVLELEGYNHYFTKKSISCYSTKSNHVCKFDNIKDWINHFDTTNFIYQTCLEQERQNCV